MELLISIHSDSYFYQAVYTCNLSKHGSLNIARSCFRMSILKDQKQKQQQDLEKLHRVSDKLKEQAEMLGEKLDDTSYKHMQLLQR